MGVYIYQLFVVLMPGGKWGAQHLCGDPETVATPSGCRMRWSPRGRKEDVPICDIALVYTQFLQTISRTQPFTRTPTRDDSLTGRPIGITHIDAGFILRYGAPPAAAVLSCLQVRG
jgi:hypothetical protein